MTSPRQNHDRARRLVTAWGTAAAAVVLASCTGGGTPVTAVTAATPTIPVLQPGRPGEPNATLTGSAAAPVTTPGIRDTDTRFLSDMIVHHAQAIVMVDAVYDDLEDRQVRAIASRIRDEQQPEIDFMAGFLEERGQQAPPEATNPRLTDHGGHAMPGMATAGDLRNLATAAGAEADRLFLRLMVRHHEGALQMVGAHGAVATDERVEELADDINITQSRQIEQMTEMLTRLS